MRMAEGGVDIAGSSGAAARMRAFASLQGRGTRPCVIMGESGTGKTRLARLIHHHSPYAPRPPVVVDLRLLGTRERRTALFGGEPPELTTTRRGALEAETTLLLRHVDRAEAFLQELLARAMRGGAFVRFGSQKERPLLARLIFIFDAHAGAGSLLAPQLAGIVRSLPACAIPPLRRRMKDLPALAAQMLGKRPGRRLLDDLKRRRWEGNVRELAVCLGGMRAGNGGGGLAADAALLAWRLREGESFSVEEVLDRMRRHASEEMLASCHGNLSRAAARLGMSSRTLGRILQ